MLPHRDKKTGRWIKGRIRPIRLCLFCHKKERRIRRKFCSFKCMGLARRGKQTWMKGKKHKPISIEKNRQAHIGKTTWNKGKECPQFSGKNHWNWKGGITKLGILIRQSLRYKEWRKNVFEKDNFTCQKCGRKGGDLEADHIKPFEQILRENHITTVQMAKKCKQLWEVSNGRTLCIPCHMKTETFPKNLRCATVRPYGKRTVRITKAN